MLHLIEYLITTDGKDPKITKPINSTEIQIMTLVNSDEFAAIKKPEHFYTNGSEEL